MSESARTPSFRWFPHGVLLILLTSSIHGFSVRPTAAQPPAAATESDNPLAAQLQNENVLQRRKAMDAILHADPDQQIAALPQLCAILGKEPDVQVRLAMIETMTRLGPRADEAVPVLLDAM